MFQMLVSLFDRADVEMCSQLQDVVLYFVLFVGLYKL